MQAEVVDLARRNLAGWGLTDRVSVATADVRSLPPQLRGPYDLITLHNNVYYFATVERTALFAELAGMLTDRGAICVVSMMAGNTVASADLDLTLRSTAGCAPLPKVDELQAQLRAAGLSTLVPTHLMPLEPLYAVVASR
jgi:cyclopropane fatty-acyl-phospholipid synthase-like methyltransferase